MLKIPFSFNRQSAETLEDQHIALTDQDLAIVTGGCEESKDNDCCEEKHNGCEDEDDGCCYERTYYRCYRVVRRYPRHYCGC